MMTVESMLSKRLVLKITVALFLLILELLLFWNKLNSKLNSISKGGQRYAFSTTKNIRDF